MTDPIPEDKVFECGCKVMCGLSETGERTMMFVACPKQLDCEVVKTFKALAEAEKARDPSNTLIVTEVKHDG